MKIIKTIFKERAIIFYCLLLAAVSLVICSQNSILYVLNDWVDANAFLTVGKGMFKGIVPYKDIFEQKGLFLYLIYGLGSLISYRTFHGVFLLEITFFTIFLFFCHKIINLFLEKKYSLIILPITTFLIVTSKAFVHGGSAEEFCLPMLSISLYYFLKHFKIKELTNKEFFIAGFCAGLVLMNKYTLLGFWIGFMIYILFVYLKERKIKKIFTVSIWFLFGMGIPFLIGLIYMGLNQGIFDFLKVYFYINMTSYTRGSSNFLFAFFKGTIKTILNNGLIIFLLITLLPYFLKKLDMNKTLRYGILTLFIFTTFFIFYGLIFFSYYVLPVFLFMLLSLISLTKYLEKYLSNEKNFIIFTIACLLIFPLGCYNFANYKNHLSKTKDDYVQFQYANIIESDPGTFVNMGGLDFGLYTTSGILPSTYFFELQNISYKKFPDNIDSFNKYIKTKQTKYILFSTRQNKESLNKTYPLLFENYILVKEEKQRIDNLEHNELLFKAK